MGRSRVHTPPSHPELEVRIKDTPSVRQTDEVWRDRLIDDTGHYDIEIDLKTYLLQLWHTPYINNEFQQTVRLMTYQYPSEEAARHQLNHRFSHGMHIWDIRSLAPEYLENLQEKAQYRATVIRDQLPRNYDPPVRKMRNGVRYLIYTQWHEGKCDRYRVFHLHAFQIWVVRVRDGEVIYDEIVECDDVNNALERYQHVVTEFDSILMETRL